MPGRDRRGVERPQQSRHHVGTIAPIAADGERHLVLARLHVLHALTGRNAHPTIIDLADTVTEMRQVKHAYEKGVMAQRGIEY